MNKINKRKEYRHQYYLKNKEKSYKQSCLWIKNNRNRYNEYLRKWKRDYHFEKKLLVLEHYGNFCKCCEEKRIEFLCIDHVEGGGKNHRKVLRRSDMAVWLWSQNFPEGFQILCFNCNMAKSIYGKCPHVNEKNIRNS